MAFIVELFVRTSRKVLCKFLREGTTMRTLLAVSAVLFYAALATAQAPDPALQKTIETRNAALWSGNASDWGRYTTDDFLGIGADGAVKGKTQRMREINGVKIKSPAQPQEEQFRRYGATVIRTCA